MSDQELIAYGQRAELELALAQAADDEDTRRIHYLEAGRYLDLFHRAGRAATDSPHPN